MRPHRRTHLPIARGSGSINRQYYPYRPAVDGIYLERFLKVSRELCDGLVALDEFGRRAVGEYEWASVSATINPAQRKIYRAAWMLLRDLVRVGWTVRWSSGGLEIAPPTLESLDPMTGKARVRQAMAETRRERLRDAREFIVKMEVPAASSGKVPISKLIADGARLAAKLDQVDAEYGQERIEHLRNVIQPYLQLVEEGVVDEYTGHKLSDIWRYFRLTWSTPAQTTPGRTLLYLVRDAVEASHPIIGIASLENAPIKVAVRDDYLGWSPSAFFGDVQTSEECSAKLKQLLGFIENGIEDIDLSGLCTAAECVEPSPEVIARLSAIAAQAAVERDIALTTEDDAGSEVGSSTGVIDATDALFRKKRAEQLARLLSGRLALKDALSEVASGSEWKDVLKRDRCDLGIRSALQAQKGRHVGTSMLELNVCGAVGPYNEILGGKLVALMMLSPQVVEDYRRRYGSRPSDIASRLKNAQVIKPAELVYVGTTSLYSVGSSQYNRIKLPSKTVGPNATEVAWRAIGTTEGFGTLHISRLTTQCLEDVAGLGGVITVNHVFGEGPSPKLRVIKQALERLFVSGHRYDDITKHAMGRIVYGAWLAQNGREILLGQESVPSYYFDGTHGPAGTETIVEYWRKRWLDKRIGFKPCLERMTAFDARQLLVSNSLDDEADPGFANIRREGDGVVANGNTMDVIRNYVRNLYRGTSAFADNTDIHTLQDLHIYTPLDDAVMQALEEGISVILTGNPGDGKTHVLRMLEKRLDSLPVKPIVDLDASAVRDADIIARWELALSEGRPYVLAINEAVLFELAAQHTEFVPIQSAREQVECAISYGDEAATLHPTDVVVFDLSQRNVLAPGVAHAVISKLTDPELMDRCSVCPVEGCDFVRNRDVLRIARVQGRLQMLLDRLSIRGLHYTIRDLEALVSYLLFGGRSCSEMLQNGSESNGTVFELVFSGRGELFRAIQDSFDPAQITHPTLDRELEDGVVEHSRWCDGVQAPSTALDDNDAAISGRRRSAFFCHENGGGYLRLDDSAEEGFGQLLAKSDRDVIREVLKMISHYFGVTWESDGITIWQSHRYGQTPRRILYSVNRRARNEFRVLRPKLRSPMSDAFELTSDHLMLVCSELPGARLRVDFELYRMLVQAQKGVPVRYIDSEGARRLWKFVDKIATTGKGAEEIRVELWDPASRKWAAVLVDTASRKVLDIQVEVRQ